MLLINRLDALIKFIRLNAFIHFICMSLGFRDPRRLLGMLLGYPWNPLRFLGSLSGLILWKRDTWKGNPEAERDPMGSPRASPEAERDHERHPI